MNVIQCWELPAPNNLRLYVDAGFDAARNRFSVGAVVRDDQGIVRGAAACVIRDPGTVIRAELCAIRFVMKFCLKLGMKDVCLLKFFTSCTSHQEFCRRFGSKWIAYIEHSFQDEFGSFQFRQPYV